MFTIIIHEKGGNERREGFEKNEINVGRVQGNDLMLPKGNVSKHHARLLYRDSRFIVTDLKSTNGTYVNGRKISQATIVREGDKIYIGDFVLRLETEASASPDDARVRAPSRPRVPTREALSPMPTAPHELAALQAALSGQGQGGPTIGPVTMPPRQVSGPPPLPPQAQNVSHYPLERDPDSESAPEMVGTPLPRVPGPPRLPRTEGRSRTGGGPPVVERGATPARSLTSSAPGSPTRPASALEVRPVQRQSPEQAARRLALITLVDRVADAVDLLPLKTSPVVDDALAQQIDRAIREQAKAMRDEGEAPEGVDLEALSRDALRELVGLGPLGPLLEDDGTQEIHVARPDHVLVLKNGVATLAEPSFTSEDAVARVLMRLVRQSGEELSPGELVVERRLARGAFVVAISPALAGGWVFTVRKRRQVDATLDELTRAGAMSRPIASFLETCVVARANILVVGSGAGAAVSMLAALASAAPPGERVAVLHDVDDIAVPHAQTVSVTLVDTGARGEEAVRATARLGLDRLIVVSLAGAVALATVEAIGEGSDGVLAGLGAPSLRHALARLAAHVALARPGASIDASREAVGESFDVAIEVARASDGSLRVLRVVELAGGDAKGVIAHDLFLGHADRDGQWAFVATGTTPRLANDLAARGARLDMAIFKAG
ncbi:MAG: ATPase, T2SS/T4P/T4SS family [Polyangiaceae bacterium]